jgi:hypothetical protein
MVPEDKATTSKKPPEQSSGGFKANYFDYWK